MATNKREIPKRRISLLHFHTYTSILLCLLVLIISVLISIGIYFLLKLNWTTKISTWFLDKTKTPPSWISWDFWERSIFNGWKSLNPPWGTKLLWGIFFVVIFVVCLLAILVDVLWCLLKVIGYLLFLAICYPLMIVILIIIYGFLFAICGLPFLLLNIFHDEFIWLDYEDNNTMKVMEIIAYLFISSLFIGFCASSTTTDPLQWISIILTIIGVGVLLFLV